MSRVTALWLSLAFFSCACFHEARDSNPPLAAQDDPRRATAQLVMRLQADQSNRAFVADLAISEHGDLEECRVRDCGAESEREICQSIKAWEFSELEKGSQFTVVFGRGSLR